MTYRSADFKFFFLNTVKAAQSTCNTYNSYLRRIDQAIGGLDEAIQRDGADGVILWGQNCLDSPFDVYTSDARAVLKRYVYWACNKEFDTAKSPVLKEEIDVAIHDVDDTEVSGVVFHLEKEMQSAVRKQLALLEPGLVEADGGLERHVATGWIDILAKDAAGKYVVIELKAGICPSGTIEQALGYAQALHEEAHEPARVIIIASDFSARTRAASKKIPDLKLLKYEFSLKYSELA